MVKIATVTLKSKTQYSPSRLHNTAKTTPKETDAAYEARTWPEKAHFDSKGNVFIPKEAFKNAIQDSAQRRGTRIPGRGKATFTKHFAGGIEVLEDLPVGMKKKNLPSVTIPAHVNGERTCGHRVPRTFPVINSWSGDIRVAILDETINEEEFESTIREAGIFVGVGRGRPQNRGSNGRFSVERIVWSTIKDL